MSPARSHRALRAVLHKWQKSFVADSDAVHFPVKDNGAQAAAAAKAASNPDKGFQDQLRRGPTSVGGVTGAAGN